MREWSAEKYWIWGADGLRGAAIARQLSAAGLNLILSGRDQDRLADLMVSLPGPASYTPLPLGDSRALNALAEELGEIDGLVHVAGDGQGDAGQVISDNLTSLVEALDLVLPQLRLRGEGHVVLVGDMAQVQTRGTQAAEQAAAAGMAHLARSYQARLSGSGVVLQCVLSRGALAPEDLARQVFEHMSGDAFLTHAPRGAGLGEMLWRLLPGWLYSGLRG